jgi:hypothetical protein
MNTRPVANNNIGDEYGSQKFYQSRVKNSLKSDKNIDYQASGY